MLKLKLQYFGHLMRSWLIEKDPDAGRDWEQEEKGTTEDEMAGWHHRLDGRESEWTPGVGDGQGGLACCDSWGRRVGNDWATDLIWYDICFSDLLHSLCMIVSRSICIPTMTLFRLFLWWNNIPLHTCTTSSLAIPLLGVYPEKTTIQKGACILLFIAALLTIARTWKKPKCSSTEEWSFFFFKYILYILTIYRGEEYANKWNPLLMNKSYHYLPVNG